MMFYARRLLAFATLAAALAAPAAAQTAGAFMANPAFQDPPPTKCESTFDMQHCAAHNLRVADAQMSARYAALRARLGPAARARLLAEQRRWLAGRERDCRAKARQFSGGTLAPVAVAQCWVDVTRLRSRALATRR